MSSTASPSFRPARAGDPLPLSALLAAARSASGAQEPARGPALAAAVPAAPPHPAPRAAAANGVTAKPVGARPNKIGLFGMVSEECLERIRRHVAPIKGLHAWTAQAIYTALAVCASRQGSASAGDGQRCWVTVAELAARTGMGRRNVERYLPVLRDAGVLRIVHAQDALHRPTASHYVFVYSHTEERDTPTPESGYPAAPVAEPVLGATPESNPPDSRVGTLLESEKSPQESGPEGGNEFERRGGTNENENVAASLQSEHLAGAGALSDPPPPAEPEVDAADGDDPWKRAQRRLAAEVTPAAYGAWLHPLVRVAPEDAPQDGAPPRVVLGCTSAFHRDQVERRYRAAIEAAVGGPVEIVLLGPPTPGGAG